MIKISIQRIKSNIRLIDNFRNPITSMNNEVDLITVNTTPLHFNTMGIASRDEQIDIAQFDLIIKQLHDEEVADISILNEEDYFEAVIKTVSNEDPIRLVDPTLINASMMVEMLDDIKDENMSPEEITAVAVEVGELFAKGKIEDSQRNLLRIMLSSLSSNPSVWQELDIPKSIWNGYDEEIARTNQG